MAGRAQHTNVTTVNLASQSGKKTQTVNDIMQAIESSMPAASQQGLAQQGGLSARLQGRINDHQLAYGDNTMPRGRLPKVDNVLLDRYQAARHNVLVLGAIQQAEGKSKSNTHSSHKSGGSRTPKAPHTSASKETRATDDPDVTEDWDAAVGPGSLSAGPSGFDDTFSSFKSRVSSKALGSIAEDALSAQPSAANLGPEPSHINARRRFNRQGSNSSVASRVSTASYASGLTGVSRASSSGQGRHLRERTSYVSSGGSSGHTLRSHVTVSIAGSRFGGHHHKKGGKRKPPKPEPGRVTRAFLEFGAKDDWFRKTLLKHTLAAIIQARWRGYWVRQRWKVNREQLVIDERERLEADSRQQARVQELQHKLLLYEQKKLAAAAAEAVAAAAAAGGKEDDNGAAGEAAGVASAYGAAAGGGSMSRAASVAWRKAEGQLGAMASWQSMRSIGDASCLGEGRVGYGAGSDSDSDWSDAELDDVAAIKFRAVTPPWQRVPDRQPMSLTLQQRTAAAALGEPLEPPVLANWAEGLGGLGSCWDDDDDTAAKLQELRHRRIIRKPEPVPLSPSAVAAAASAGLLASSAAAGTEGSTASPTASAAADEAEAEAEPSTAAALPRAVVEALLLERYSGKYTRLGLPHKMPGRQQWLKMQAEAAAAAAEEQSSAEAAAAQAEVAAAAAAAASRATGVFGGADAAAGPSRGTGAPAALPPTAGTLGVAADGAA